MISMDLLASSLRELIEKKSVTKKGVKSMLDIHKATFYKKLENVGEFKSGELIKLADFLGIPFIDICRIVEHEYRVKN
ncbi:MAG: hypothetical protein H7329_10675 [Opitutaceae bacterium]|nr:hypothetical protein [Cytophagales bacterium]